MHDPSADAGDLKASKANGHPDSAPVAPSDGPAHDPGQDVADDVDDARGNAAPVEMWVRDACGQDLDALIHAMRDHDAPPLTLPPSDHVANTAPVLDAAYSACAAQVEQRLAAHPEETGNVRGWLPSHLADPKEEHLVAALLEAATHTGYYGFGDVLFDAKNASARTYEQHPELLADVDDDGLLRTGGYRATAQVVFHRGSALKYHRFLGRGFAGHVNETLTQRLIDVAAGGAAELRMALDEQHFMAATAFTPYFERDYWFGPHLTATVLDDPHKTGATVHADPSTGLMHEYPRLFASTAMDKEGNKVIQIEELSDDNSSNQGGYRLLRYLHAIRDIEHGAFIHCDGAVRAYTPEQYARRQTREYVTGRESAARYRKVFRLDGAIETAQWSEVAAGWFRGNLLIREYLSSLKARPDDSPTARSAP